MSCDDGMTLWRAGEEDGGFSCFGAGGEIEGVEGENWMLENEDNRALLGLRQDRDAQLCPHPEALFGKKSRDYSL